MSQGDQFHQYGYDHYLKAPARKVDHSRSSMSYGGDGLFSSLLYSLGTSALLRKLQSPLVAGGVLLGAVALFSGVVMLTYSSDDSSNEPVPIIRADISDIKQAPSIPGGMDIPHRQSTILARGDQPSDEAQVQAVENLLASQGNEDLISKEEAFYRATQSPILGDDGTVISFSDAAEAQDDLAALHAQAGGAIDVTYGNNTDNVSVASVANEISVAPSAELEKPVAEDILQKIGSTKEMNGDSEQVAHYSKAFVDMTAKAAVSAKPAPPLSVAASLLSEPTTSSQAASVASANKPTYSDLHGAGQSPETLDYVRSVLDKNSQDSGGVQVHGVEPASGTVAEASPDITLGAGSFFVQLASITDAKRAPEEWAKMQNKYSVLEASRFRVQEASLPGGTFYRIQAGPMSKDSATQVCDSLKQANKPGGCLVVQ
jgi:hypothetical protein